MKFCDFQKFHTVRYYGSRQGSTLDLKVSENAKNHKLLKKHKQKLRPKFD